MSSLHTSAEYRASFVGAVSACVQVAKREFPEIRFSSALIYMPLMDGRRAFDSNECILLPMKTKVTVDDALRVLMEGGAVADDVAISVYGVCDGSIVIEVDARNFIDPSRIYSVEDVFTVLGPSQVPGSGEGFLLMNIRFSENEIDMIVGDIFSACKDEKSIIRVAGMAAASISSGCTYSEKFVDSLSERIRGSDGALVLVSLIELCAIAKFKDAYKTIVPYVADENRAVREACYFALCALGGEQERKTIIESVRREIDPSARYFLLRNVFSRFSDNRLFIHEILSSVELTSKEKKLFDRTCKFVRTS